MSFGRGILFTIAILAVFFILSYDYLFSCNIYVYIYIYLLPDIFSALSRWLSWKVLQIQEIINCDSIRPIVYPRKAEPEKDSAIWGSSNIKWNIVRTWLLSYVLGRTLVFIIGILAPILSHCGLGSNVFATSKPQKCIGATGRDYFMMFNNSASAFVFVFAFLFKRHSVVFDIGKI